MTLLMHVAATGTGFGIYGSTSSGTSEHTQAPIAQPPPGETFQSDEEQQTSLSSKRSSLGGEQLLSGREQPLLDGDKDDTTSTIRLSYERPDPWIPIVKTAFGFARKHIYMAEVRAYPSLTFVEWSRNLRMLRRGSRNFTQSELPPAGLELIEIYSFSICICQLRLKMCVSSRYSTCYRRRRHEFHYCPGPELSLFRLH